MRHTVIAHSLLKMRELRLEAARGRRRGLQIMTFEQLAARLAGGLAQPVDDDALREAITAVLPETALGELDGIKALPGMVGAAADTLRKAWRAGVDLGLDALPALDLEHLPPETDAGEPAAENAQTRKAFAAEAAAIAECTHRIVWRAPSRDEDTAQPVLREEEPTIIATDGDGAPADGAVAAMIQGGRERGTILHKLIEEVLTGETAEEETALAARAEILIHALGLPVTDDPAQGLAPAELAGCVLRALALPEVAALRPGLVPEFPIYSSTKTDSHEEATAGIVDAIAFGPDGAPQVVIDWKSDVNHAPETLDHYRAQVRAYLDVTGAERGMVATVTGGTVIPVTRRELKVAMP